MSNESAASIHVRLERNSEHTILSISRQDPHPVSATTFCELTPETARALWAMEGRRQAERLLETASEDSILPFRMFGATSPAYGGSRFQIAEDASTGVLLGISRFGESYMASISMGSNGPQAERWTTLLGQDDEFLFEQSNTGHIALYTSGA